ncbi:right-handed parallel beta-helix repeat-containing protein [Domibacillus robiginosus]|uniref:right-handed parallel beta-helix repeat-containing protein n=1 Tax=Domibacillus robiginosus TaxID=1071054 RepID=UPI000AA59CD0|nr:right-handed parallel beta-helix repeat-containing protein [Domibacillus robiginosus]
MLKRKPVYTTVLLVSIVSLFLLPSTHGLCSEKNNTSIENRAAMQLDTIQTDYGVKKAELKAFSLSNENVEDTSFLANVTDYGAQPDDSEDDTAAIQAAINAADGQNAVVRIPAGTFLINTDPQKGSLHVKDNIEIQMAEKTVLKSIPNALPVYRIFTIYNGENIKISGGSLVGDRYKHEGTTGEFGHGIYIGGSSSKINISNVKAQDFWGDGFFIEGDAKLQTYPTDIVISQSEAHNNRRQGLSITAGKNIVIKNNIFSKTNGTAPEAGIDLERDPPFNLPLENVKLTNNKIIDNNGYGIAFVYASGNEAKNNVVLNNKGGGFYVGGNREGNGTAEQNSIKNNFVSENGIGIYVNFSTDNHITNNTIIENKKDGIFLVNHIGKNQLVNNFIAENQGNGIYVWGGLSNRRNIVIKSNEVESNWKTGIAIFEVTSATVTDNNLVNNRGEGLEVQAAKKSSISSNKSKGNKSD